MTSRSTRRLIPRSARGLLLFLRFQSVHIRGREAIETWQAWKLSKLIPYLSRNVPLYKELVAEMPHVERTLANLPLMSEANFKNRFVEDYTDRSLGFLGAQRALHHRGKNIFLLRRPHLALPRFRDSLRYRFLLWERPWRLDASWAKIARIAPPEPELGYFDISKEDVLRDPKPLETFAPEVIDADDSLAALSHLSIRPRIIVTAATSHGKHPTPVLGAEMYQRLDFDEFGPIAVECDKHDGLHIHAESFIVEILDGAGNALSEGKEGRIIVTDLYNYQMPFVRYDTGAHARLSWEKCACGLHAPRLFLAD